MANDILIEARRVTRILPGIVPTTLVRNVDLTIRGKGTVHMAEEERAFLRLSELGFVFQFHFLLPEFTAQENVMLPMRALARLSREAGIRRAADLLDSLGL